MQIVGVVCDREDAEMIEYIAKVAFTGNKFRSLLDDKQKLEKQEDREINAIIDAEINRLKNRKGL